MHREARQGLDQQVRRLIRQSRSLRVVKALANRVISRSGLGDTLVGYYQKPK